MSDIPYYWSPITVSRDYADGNSDPIGFVISMTTGSYPKEKVFEFKLGDVDALLLVKSLLRVSNSFERIQAYHSAGAFDAKSR